MPGFPERDFNDRQTHLPGVFINQRAMFSAVGIAIHLEYALTSLAQ